MVTIAPITSTIRGVAAEVLLDESDGMKNPSVANMLNLVTVPERCIGPRVAKLSPAKLEEACSAMRFALGCD